MTEQTFGAAPHERPVPRIAIHAFCEFPDTGAALQQAAEDRRLAKAHVTVQLGGLASAVEQYTGNVTPNLLIVETRLHGAAALAEIDRLAEVCDPSTKVVIVGRANDIELYRELIRRGVSEYLVAPVNPLNLIEVISGLYLNPDAAPIGRVISFIGARGGAGSSTLAHNAAWAIAERLHINTALIDFDLAFGTATLNFNEEAGQGVADALTAPERLDDVLLDRLLQKAGDHLSLFTAPALLERDYEFPPEAFHAVIEAVRSMTPCVVLDLPHVWTPWVRQTLLTSDEIVIVATPELASLRNGKAIYELVKQKRPNDNPPRLVINQVGVPKRPEIPAKDFGETLGLPPSLIMPFEPAIFGSAANNGQMLMDAQPRSPVSDLVERLAQLLTGRTPAAEAKPAQLFSFLTPAAETNPAQLFSFLKGRKRA